MDKVWVYLLIVLLLYAICFPRAVRVLGKMLRILKHFTAFVVYSIALYVVDMQRNYVDRKLDRALRRLAKRQARKKA